MAVAENVPIVLPHQTGTRQICPSVPLLGSGTVAGLEEVQPEPAQKTVVISAANGNINIRFGNGTNYARITSVPSGTKLPFVASAENGWYAVIVNGKVGWVSGEYASIA